MKVHLDIEDETRRNGDWDNVRKFWDDMGKAAIYSHVDPKKAFKPLPAVVKMQKNAKAKPRVRASEEVFNFEDVDNS